MTEVEKSLEEGHMIETEEDNLHSEVDPEVAIIQEDYIEDKTIMEIEMTVDKEGLEVNPDYQQEDLQLPQGL